MEKLGGWVNSAEMYNFVDDIDCCMQTLCGIVG